jgi:hypothetical protein
MLLGGRVMIRVMSVALVTRRDNEGGGMREGANQPQERNMW